MNSASSAKPEGCVRIGGKPRGSTAWKQYRPRALIADTRRPSVLLAAWGIKRGASDNLLFSGVVGGGGPRHCGLAVIFSLSLKGIQGTAPSILGVLICPKCSITSWLHRDWDGCNVPKSLRVAPGLHPCTARKPPHPLRMLFLAYGY